MKKVLAVLAATTALAALAPSAHATLAFWADVGGTIISCTDGAACDTNPNPGQLSIADQTVNGVQIQGNSANQTVGPPQNSLNTSSFQITNNTGATVPITVLIGGTSFASPVSTTNASGGGTWENAIGSNLTLAYFLDPANGQGALGGATPGTDIASFINTATINPQTFAFNSGNISTNESGPFSMTLEASGNLVSGGILVGRTQAIINEVSPVPEPGTLGLLGAALIGFVGLTRRRRKGGTANA